MRQGPDSARSTRCSRIGGKCLSRALALACSTALCASRPTPLLRDITIVGNAYTYTAPESLDADVAIISFENRGRVPHDMVISRTRDDVPDRLFAYSLVWGAVTVPIRATGSGLLFANPSSRNDLVRMRLDLRRGERYAIHCPRCDSASTPKHDMLSMVKRVVVRSR